MRDAPEVRPASAPAAADIRPLPLSSPGRRWCPWKACGPGPFCPAAQNSIHNVSRVRDGEHAHDCDFTHLHRVRRQLQELISLDDEVPARVPCHFREVVREFFERRSAIRVQHPALHHCHVNVYGANWRLRQSLSLLQQLRYISRRDVLVRSLSVSQQFPHGHSCKSDRCKSRAQQRVYYSAPKKSRTHRKPRRHFCE